MNCDQTQQLLLDYYYEELPASQRAEVARHLSSCSACAKQYCRMHADLTGLGDLLEQQPRPAVRSRLRQRVSREFAPSPWQRLTRLCTFPIPAYQTVLVLTVLLLLWTMLGGARPPHSAAVPRQHPAPVRATVLEQGYDASRIFSLDPNLL